MTRVTHVSFCFGAAGAFMLALLPAAAPAGVSGQGIAAFTASAPSIVERVHAIKGLGGNHRRCRRHVPPPIASPGADRCHRHVYYELDGWRVVPCPERACR